MRFSKVDIFVLVIPLLIMIIIIPFLPDQVPFHWNIKGEVDKYVDRKFSFVLGFLPFIIYKAIQSKYGRKK